MKKSILKTIIMGYILLLMLPMVGCSRRQGIAQTQRPVDDVYDQTDGYEQPGNDQTSYQVFYDDLSPYGSWIDYPGYGYVWIPRVSADFHPYATEGHWVMTDYGWTWVSDLRWGWAAFHYGRWAYEPQYGWLWIPGNVWGPAWVSWREDNDYFGWVPLGPFGRASVSFNYPNDHYRFVPRRYFADRYVYNHYENWHNNSNIINHTTVINETHIVNKRTYYYGPRKDFVEQAGGQKIRESKVYDRDRPDADAIDNDRVKVYRPRLDNVPKDARKPAPNKIERTSDLQQIPTDKRLTPSPRRETPQRTEGGQNRPNTQRPRRNDVPQQRPDVRTQPIPNDEPRPNIPSPRRNDVPQQRPDVRTQPVPTNEPRQNTRLPRRGETQQQQPNSQPNTKQPRKERTNTQPVKEKRDVPPKRKDGD